MALRARELLQLLRPYRGLMAALAVYAAVALVLCEVPLFDLLGYESSLVIALVASFVGAHLAVHLVHAFRSGRSDPLTLPMTPAGTVLWLYGRALALNLVALLLPLDVMTANAALVRNCNYLDGLLWFLVLPVGSVAVATAWGVALGLAFRGRWAWVLADLVVLGSLGWTFVRFYAAPPVQQYDPFFGYFSGNLYDDHIVVTASLLWARASHLAGALAVLLVAVRFYRADRQGLAWSAGEPRRAATAVALAGIALAAGLWALGGALAFRVSEADLERALGGLRRTPHTEIVYDRSSPVADEIDWHAVEAEFRWEQLSRFFGAAPTRRIRIYYFADSEQKRRLYGAERVDMAKPWRLETYLTARPFPHGVLRHELAHAFASAFGDPVFGVSFRWGSVLGFLPVPQFNPGLIEGAAVAADWPTREGLTPHEWSAAMRRLGVAQPLAAVMSYAFLAASSARSYTLAGSFCRFLVERYGAASFRRVYRNGGDFRAAYGRGLPLLEVEWNRFLDAVPLDDATLALARERFRRRPVFATPCAHEVARLVSRAEAELGEGAHGRAARTYDRARCYDPGDPDHLLGRLHAEVGGGNASAAELTTRDLFLHPAVTPPLQGTALWLLGNLAWRERRDDRARAFFARAADFALPEGMQRDLAVRALALSQPRLNDRLRILLGGASGERASTGDWEKLPADLPDLGLAHYLLGSHYLLADRPADAARSLERALELGLPDARFVREAVLRLGRAHVFAQAWADARRAFQRLDVAEQRPAVRLEAREWIARADFFARHAAALGLRPRPAPGSGRTPGEAP
jgi:tetratricopeptide (TPR) repeat protein